MMTVDFVALGRYLNGQASPEERAAVEAWLGADAERRAAVVALQAAWAADTRHHQAPYDTDAAWRRFRHRVGRTTRLAAPVPARWRLPAIAAGRGRDAGAHRPGGNAVQRGRRTRTARRQRDGRAGVDPRTPRLREPAARRGRTAAGPVVRPRRSRRGFGARAPAGHGLLWRRARHASPHAHHGRRGRSLRVARPVGDHLNGQRTTVTRPPPGARHRNGRSDMYRDVNVNTRATWRVTVAIVAELTVAAGGGALRLAAQDPAAGLALAAAGPRFLAAETGRASDSARWRDASNAAVFRQRISLDLRDLPLGEALSVIARRAGLRLTYSAAVVPLDTPVTLSASNLTVGAVLSAVLYDTGVDVLLTAHGQAVLVKRGILDEPQVGAVVGRVSDSISGHGVGLATVSVEGVGLRATSADDGSYRIANVPVGPHTVKAARIGTPRCRSRSPYSPTKTSRSTSH